MKSLVIAKNEELLIKGLQACLKYKVYLDKDNMVVRNKASKCVVMKFRVKNNMLEAYR